MANPFIGHGRLSDAATVTTGNEETTLPASNVQSMQPSKRWRTTNNTNCWIQFDFGAAVALDFVAVCSHNGSAADTLRVRASADSTPTTSPDYDSSTQNLYPSATKPTWPSWRTHWDSHYVFASTQTWRYWRIDFAVAGSYWEAGRIILGLRTQLNLQYPFSRGHVPSDVVEITPSGGTLTDGRGRPRAWSFPVDLYEESAEMAIDEIDAERGIGDDVYVCEDPDATTYLHRKTMLAVIKTISPIDRPDYGVRSKRYDLLELL